MPFDNEEKYLRAEYRILRALAANSPLGFNELQRRACVSSKTLDKHLHKQSLVPRTIEKVGEKYRLTSDGGQRMKNIEQQLDGSRKSNPGKFPMEMIEVYSIGPNHSCRGTLTGFSSRKLRLEERANLDKSITELIYKIKQVMPAGSNWKVSMNWRSRG